MEGAPFLLEQVWVKRYGDSVLGGGGRGVPYACTKYITFITYQTRASLGP